MKKDLLVVIDPQNVYMPGYDWACPNMPKAVENIKGLLDTGSEKFDVVFTEFVAPKMPVGKWATYNSINKEINENRFLNEIVPELKCYLDRFPLLAKSTYSAFDVIRDKASEYENIVLAGVVAECCVLATAMALIDSGRSVYYLTDCVAGQNDDFEASVAKIIDSLSYAHGKVLTSKEYLDM